MVQRHSGARSPRLSEVSELKVGIKKAREEDVVNFNTLAPLVMDCDNLCS